MRIKSRPSSLAILLLLVCHVQGLNHFEGWHPVPSSRVAQLPYGYQENGASASRQPPPREQQQINAVAQDRIDIVEEDVEDVKEVQVPLAAEQQHQSQVGEEDNEDVTETTLFVTHNQHQQVNNGGTDGDGEKDLEPVIIYPVATVPENPPQAIQEETPARPLSHQQQLGQGIPQPPYFDFGGAPTQQQQPQQQPQRPQPPPPHTRQRYPQRPPGRRPLPPPPQQQQHSLGRPPPPPPLAVPKHGPPQGFRYNPHQAHPQKHRQPMPQPQSQQQLKSYEPPPLLIQQQSTDREGTPQPVQLLPQIEPLEAQARHQPDSHLQPNQHPLPQQSRQPLPPRQLQQPLPQARSPLPVQSQQPQELPPVHQQVDQHRGPPQQQHQQAGLPPPLRGPPPPFRGPPPSRGSPPPRGQPPLPRGPPTQGGRPQGGRPRVRPRPRPRPSGGSKSVLSTITDKLKCAATDIYADQHLGDTNYMRQQMDCVLQRGPCDENGALIKRMAPDILKGLCPRPCDECKRNQIRKAMAVISHEYPREWSEMTRQFAGK